MFLEVQNFSITQPLTRPKAKVSLKCLIAWLETQSGSYNPDRVEDCPLYHFARAVGFDHEVAYHMSYLMGESDTHNAAIFAHPCTYEAALERAKALRE
jgi:hypothetical protein